MINFLSINKKRLNESNGDDLEWANDAIKNLPPIFNVTQTVDGKDYRIDERSKMGWIESLTEWNESELSKDGTKILQMGGSFSPSYALKFYLERGGYVLLGDGGVSYIVDDVVELSTTWDEHTGAWDMVKKFLLSLQVRMPINESEEDKLNWVDDVLKSEIRVKDNNIPLGTKVKIKIEYQEDFPCSPYDYDKYIKDGYYIGTVEHFGESGDEGFIVKLDGSMGHWQSTCGWPCSQEFNYTGDEKCWWVDPKRDEIYVYQENIHESEDDALDWAVEAINDDVYKWGSIKKILNDGDIISISGDICDGEGGCDLTLKDEPFIFSRNSRGVPYIRWSNDLDKRPSGWSGPSDTSKDAIRMDTATTQWDDELDVKILKREEYPF